MRSILFISVVAFLLSGCGENNNDKGTIDRWYSQSQVDSGRVVFRRNCSVCHGENAQGTPDWKNALPDGASPPPALNGSAHAWHHPMGILKRTIDVGGAPLGGKMPPFKGRLNEEEKEAAIAFFQSFWSDKTYEAWLGRGGLKK